MSWSVEVVFSKVLVACDGVPMRDLDGRILLSASDLMRFTGCAHATTLDLAYLQGHGLTPRDDSDDARHLQKQGAAHEAAHL